MTFFGLGMPNSVVEAKSSVRRMFLNLRADDQMDATPGLPHGAEPAGGDQTDGLETAGTIARFAPLPVGRTHRNVLVITDVDLPHHKRPENDMIPCRDNAVPIEA